MGGLAGALLARKMVGGGGSKKTAAPVAAPTPEPAAPVPTAPSPTPNLPDIGSNSLGSAGSQARKKLLGE